MANYKKISTTSSAIGFLIIGIFLAVASIWGIVDQKTSTAVYAETTGTIVKIDEQQVDDGDNGFTTEYTPYINYTVDGKTYENVQYGAYDSSMKVGSTVTVQYDTKDPANIKAPGSEKIPYIVLAVSIVCIIVSVVLFIKRFVKKGLT